MSFDKELKNQRTSGSRPPVLSFFFFFFLFFLILWNEGFNSIFTFIFVNYSTERLMEVSYLVSGLKTIQLKTRALKVKMVKSRGVPELIFRLFYMSSNFDGIVEKHRNCLKWHNWWPHSEIQLKASSIRNAESSSKNLTTSYPVLPFSFGDGSFSTRMIYVANFG
jgi:hypothetical protein